MQGLMAPSRRLQLPGGDFLFDPVRKMGDPSGLPRNGLVALYDPYRDAYGLDATARAALQTGVDYSGRGNTLTYGATTGASTDDPSNTGTAWSFDGGDYLGMPAQAVGDITVYTVFKVNASLTGSYPGLWGRKNIDAYWEKSTSKVCVDAVSVSGLKTVKTASALTKDVWYLHTARCTAAGLCSSSVTPIPSSIATIGATMAYGAVSAGSAVGRIEASYGMEGLIAYLAMYNVCHSDSIVATVHRMITGKMASRGIAL